ncbi:hypothetical protein DL89DRAFT_268857 [Linderina pennispora]|uniref:SRR1-like domain-containing protein n=1 Tax=Linderina pennispora TaxID=61395 RepID=A0A1Y1W4A1_9FUNG|nr:uncharacterized protein DL89DRAFT_268857 [Linderina pennispora]ORX68351.1 hypothetical protein DL89DRAFT_268857 [Linderina pennispora]
MPHCEQFLYDNLLGANSATLANLMIIGNHFSGYQDAQTAAQFLARSPNIAHALPSLSTTSFPPESQLGLRHAPFAFTDTCLQHFRTGCSVPAQHSPSAGPQTSAAADSPAP